jgi:tetratricopeptide (TPR) repeat protein
MAASTSDLSRITTTLRRAMNATVGKKNPRPDVLDEAHAVAVEAAAVLAKAGGGFDPEVYSGLDDDLPADLRAWLLELPSFLSKKQRKGEGEQLCDLYAPIFGAGYLDAERAIVLWEAGERDAARAALTAAKEKHAGHCWPLLRSAWALEQEGRQEDALKGYEAAVEAARGSEQKKDLRFCWDGLVQFHYNKGDQAKAVEASRQMLKDCPELEQELKVETIRNETVKPGRNDPCTCGSGKKYKKCCGAAA